MNTCTTCGELFDPAQVGASIVKVNVGDATREILLCGPCNEKIWREAMPGSWFSLHDGESAQLAEWGCPICDELFPYTEVQYARVQYPDDNHYGDDEAPPRNAVVCGSCLSKFAV